MHVYACKSLPGLEAEHVATVFRTLDINLKGAIGVAEIICLKVMALAWRLCTCTRACTHACACGEWRMRGTRRAHALFH
jgi:hypothetical protein